MATEEYSELRRQVFDFYGKGDYVKALQSALTAHQNYPDMHTDTAYWLGCLYALLNQTNEAVAALQSAVDEDLWWSPGQFRHERDFSNIKEAPGFKALLQRIEKLYETAQSGSKPTCLEYLPESLELSEDTTVLMALHLRSADLSEFADIWRPIADANNFMLVLPGSSQLCSPTRRCWDDLDTAREEIKKHILDIREKYSLKPGQLILAGASQGGRIAIDIATSCPELSIEKVLLVMPFLLAEDDYAARLIELKLENLRGHIIVGDKDFSYPHVKSFHVTVAEAKLPWQLDVIPELCHNFPEDFNQRVRQALDFLNQ